VRLVFTILTAAILVTASPDVRAQPRFGVEAAAGQNVGFTSYVDNVVVVQGNRPLLVDEITGTGAAFDLRFVLNEWEIGAGVHLFDRDTIRIHHRGLEELPENRIRPDGSVDDSGIDYAEIEPIRSPSPATQPGSLLVIDVGAGYRWYVIDTSFGLYFPVYGGLVATHILEPNQPTILGVSAATGFGLSYDVAPPIGVFVSGRVHGVLTPAYRPLADAARTSTTAGETTEEAVFSAMAHGVAIVGLQFTVR
jgi:hypothetical protein